MLSVAPASAQATRTWVSGVGDDANPCSRTAPCKTFAGAISKTAGGGEINVLDPGGFGGVTITKSMTIRSTFEAGVLVSGTNAIVIAATGADNVILEGLDIEGLGTGLNGVTVTGAIKSVLIQRSSINRFTQNAVNFASTTTGARLTIRNTTITNNTNGVNVANPAGVSLSASVADSVLEGNTNFGLQANGATSVITYWNDTITAAGGTQLNKLNGGQIISFGPSSVVSSGTPNNTLAFQ